MLTEVMSLLAIASTIEETKGLYYETSPVRVLVQHKWDGHTDFLNMIDDAPVRLDMCRTLLEDEKCNRTMPIMNGHYPATKPDDRLVVRISPDRGKYFTTSTEFYPYNCHILKNGELTTEENAFVLGGCPHKKNVAIYQSKIPIRVEFTMRDVLEEFQTQMSGNYIVKCVVAECSRMKSYNKCPAYDHCERGIEWNPGVQHVNVYQTPAAIKMRFYPMYQSAHRH